MSVRCVPVCSANCAAELGGRLVDEVLPIRPLRGLFEVDDERGVSG